MNADIPRCALSGATAPIETLTTDDDSESATPLDWLVVSVRRRRPNPAWLNHVQVKEGLIAGSVANALAQRPAGTPEPTEEQRVSIAAMFRSQFDASYAYLLATTPRWLDEVEEAYIAPPESDKQLGEAWAPIAKALGVTIGLPPAPAVVKP